MTEFPLENLKPSHMGKKSPTGEWSIETKIEVATKLQVVGNMRKVSEETGVPYGTIQAWREQDWWEQLNAEIAHQRRAELSGKLGIIIAKALDLVEERLELGDFVLNNKTGQILRKPVALKDATKVVTEIMAKQIKLEEMNKTDAVATVSIQDQLKTLATEFAKFNKTMKRAATDIAFKET